ncbi:hypothetical protein UT300012_23730 [Paraclostridium bifermentans]
MEKETLRREVVRLRYIRMINCQSWKDASITLADGLNAIRSSDNNVGKSVVMKLLRVASCPGALSKSEKEALIRIGEEYAEVHYGFSNNSAGIVRIFKQRIIYLYTEDVNTGNFTQTEGVPHPKLVENLGMIVDTERGFLANFIDSEQPMLLVNSDSRLNYNLAKVLTEHQTLTRLSENFREKLPVYRRHLTDLEGKVDRLTHNKKGLTYVDVDRLSRDLEAKEVLIDCFGKVIELFEIAEEVEEELNTNDYVDFKPLESLGNFLCEHEGLMEIATDELDYKPIDESLVILGGFLADNEELLGIDVDEVLPATIDEELVLLGNLLVDLDEVTKDIDISKEEKTVDYEGLVTLSEAIIKLDDLMQCGIKAFNLMGEMEKVKARIDELNKISFDGEIYECPIYGRVQYLNGKCEVR